MAAQGRVLPVPVAVYIASEIARGLSYAHDFENLNLVHRDINPPNVRLTYAGEVKLLDFGIASSDLHGEAQASIGPRANCGTWRPSNFGRATSSIGEPISTRSACSCGSCSRSGRWAPVRDHGREDQAARNRGRNPDVDLARRAPAAVDFNAEVPPELDAVVKQATSVRPENRFANADELRRALAVFIPPEVHPELWLSLAMKEIFRARAGTGGAASVGRIGAPPA
jgi:hypothetical protein